MGEKKFFTPGNAAQDAFGIFPELQHGYSFHLTST
jgi:hypothetical protein